MTWISATLNPPPPWVLVLATDGIRVFLSQLTESLYEEGETIWMDEKKREWYVVTHWQELPEPPRKK